MSGQSAVMRVVSGMVSVLAIVLVAACGSSPPTSYYTLEPVYAGPTAENLDAVRIGVGPFVFPELLDRPQIVVRGDRNEVILSEFARWADDLEQRFQAVVARNLVVAIGTGHVYEHPWRDNFNVDYRVLGIVDRFSVDTTGTVKLKVRWVAQDGTGPDMLVTQEGVYTENANPDDFGDIAAAMSRVAASFAGDIAKNIPEL